jgi:hypothetical protein
MELSFISTELKTIPDMRNVGDTFKFEDKGEIGPAGVPQITRWRVLFPSR